MADLLLLSHGYFLLALYTRSRDLHPANLVNSAQFIQSLRLILIGRGAITPYVPRITSTLPASPSTVIICPVWMRRVAMPVPMTAGMPYSRATIEL